MDVMPVDFSMQAYPLFAYTDRQSDNTIDFWVIMLSLQRKPVLSIFGLLRQSFSPGLPSCFRTRLERLSRFQRNHGHSESGEVLCSVVLANQIMA